MLIILPFLFQLWPIAKRQHSLLGGERSKSWIAGCQIELGRNCRTGRIRRFRIPCCSHHNHRDIDQKVSATNNTYINIVHHIDMVLLYQHNLESRTEHVFIWHKYLSKWKYLEILTALLWYVYAFPFFHITAWRNIIPKLPFRMALILYTIRLCHIWSRIYFMLSKLVRWKHEIGL